MFGQMFYIDQIKLYNFSFDLHNGDDYEEFDDDLEDSLLEFFQQVGDKIKQSM